MNNTRRLLIQIVTGVIALGIIIFIYSRLAPYASGPQIVEINVSHNMYHDEYAIELEAMTKRALSAQVNGVRIPINDQGELRHITALQPGRNTIMLDLEDGFNRTKRYEYQITTPPSEEIYVPRYNDAVTQLEEELTEEALETESEAPSNE